MPPRRNLPSRECGRLPQANHTEGAPFLRVLCARVGPETDRTTGFWLAQRRGPQYARFWRDGVERFTAAIAVLFSTTALAAEVNTARERDTFPLFTHARKPLKMLRVFSARVSVFHFRPLPAPREEDHIALCLAAQRSVPLRRKLA